MLRVVPYTVDHEPMVAAFNRRLEAGGSSLRFPSSSVPRWLPPGLHPHLYNEYFVAIDDAGDVRGGYYLKHQEFDCGGENLSLGNYAWPLSEGVVDRKYGVVGVSLIHDAMKRQPLLFGLGIGGMNQPTARVMRGVRWEMEFVPFYFRVLRPHRVLRKLAYLRRRPHRRLLFDLAAWSGVGWLGATLDRLARRRVSAAARGTSVAATEAFGPWADRVWQASRADYALGAVRDAAVASVLYPKDDARFLRLHVTDGGRDVGWAVLLRTEFRSDPYFGDLRVGTIVDGLAAAADVPALLFQADRRLQQESVDLVVSNQAHAAWGAGLLSLGYRRGPSNFIFAASPELVARLGPLRPALPRLHLNRGDGDGPIHL